MQSKETEFSIHASSKSENYEKQEYFVLSHRNSCLVTPFLFPYLSYHPLTQNDLLVSSDSLHMTLKKHNP